MSEPARMSMMDDVLVSRRSARARERDEFPELFAALYPRLVRTVWFVVHDHAMAEEIAQDAFMELHRQWPRVREHERIDLWLRKVALRRARHEAAREVRRRHLERRTARDELVEDATSPDPALVAALRALSPQQRAAAVLYYLEDRPMAEVAEILGCSPSTGFVHLHDARERLRVLLAEVTEEGARDVQ